MSDTHNMIATPSYYEYADFTIENSMPPVRASLNQQELSHTLICQIGDERFLTD